MAEDAALILNHNLWGGVTISLYERLTTCDPFGLINYMTLGFVNSLVLLAAIFPRQIIARGHKGMGEGMLWDASWGLGIAITVKKTRSTISPTFPSRPLFGI